MENVTVRCAITEVLKMHGKGLSPREIYEKITELKLYQFKSINPISIVNSELRKSCVGINLKKSRSEKLFEINENGKYILKSI